MKDIRQKLLATFQVEHREHVEQIRSLVALIEKTAGQPAGAEIDEAFRRAHSLKGAARAVDLTQVEGLAHGLETLFSRVRQGKMPLDEQVAGVVQQVLDASDDCVAALGQNPPAHDFRPALHAIHRVLGIEPEAGAAGNTETPEPAPAFQPLATMRITAQNLDGLLQSAGELLAESQRQDQVAAHLTGFVRQAAGIEKQAERLRRLGATHDFVRVSASLDSMREQLRDLSKEAGTARRLHQRSSWTMRRLGNQLQRDVRQARLVPAESLFEGYRKMVRDLARDQSKQIEFRATSSGVHADRRVLETLKDPLMHLLRNAVSHGIETPQERVAKGKPPMALVTLGIDANGMRLTIVIRDNGRGLDLARVAEVAIGQGILSESEAARRSPEELARVVFRPGFSTARAVTDLSGRGMGLSVVYEAVRRLQGDVELRPADGGGTSVHLSVPLSISTHRLLLVNCAGQPFAVPIHGIERLYRIGINRVETMEGKAVVVLEGRAIPLFSLNHLLHIQEDSNAVTNREAMPVMILRSGGQRVAVVVGAFLREMDTTIQDLGLPPGGKIAGGILIENGEIAFVLNLTELLDRSGHSGAPSFLRPAAPSPELGPPSSILAVDDSMTTRTLEKSILEAHGYRVRVAFDGLEALDQLRLERPDLVITDIQMPRLDGFGLLEAMKKDETLKQIPVIVVSSLDLRQDQERGLSLGADAYIVKRKFDQGELLAAIRQII